MLINEPDPKIKVVDDLDIIFVGGVILPITVDKEAGDSVDMDTHKEAIVVNKAPSISVDGISRLPAETTTIFRSNILYIVRREREVTELTTAQREEWNKTFQEMTSKAVN